jgi:hypothetical protein
MHATRWTVLLVPALALFLGGCPAEEDTKTLEWSFTGLEALGTGFVYEGWILVDGTPISTGRFDIDEEGAASTTSVEIDIDDADAATDFVLSIEPDPDDSDDPADTKVLGGAFNDEGTADLTVGHAAALGDDLSGAAGSYILNTPTTATDDEDYDQGIWWLSMPGPAASLTLPTLPAGWAYEGWVVVADIPTTTGRFPDGTAEDDDGAGPDAGEDGYPPFPGQDYIDPALVLIGGLAVISIEPEPDDSPNPFALKPLVDSDITDEGIGVTQDMENNAAASNPAGMATWVDDEE